MVGIPEIISIVSIREKSSSSKEDDTFQRQMLFYKERYQEEFLAAAAAGISYDMNTDGVYDTSEIDYVDAGRLVR